MGLILLAPSTPDSMPMTDLPPTPRALSMRASTPTTALHRIPSPLSTPDSTPTTVLQPTLSPLSTRASTPTMGWPLIPSPLSTPDSTPTMDSLPTPSTPFTARMAEGNSKSAPHFEQPSPCQYGPNLFLTYSNLK